MIRTCLVLLGLTSVAHAAAPPMPLTPDTLRIAHQRGVERLVLAGKNWQRNRTCFSCHHQTLPMLALAEAGADAEWMRAQADHTREHFRKLTDTLVEGKSIGGGAFTAVYGLWGLSLAGCEPDETSRAIVTYLLKVQLKNGTWNPSCVRPPSQESVVALTVLALAQMQRHADDKQRPLVEKARTDAVVWLSKARLSVTEDLAFRLWGLHQLGGDESARHTARTALIKAQRSDGGWGQNAERPSDAYATGQALYVLLVTGSEDDATRRAAWWLVRNQYPDGSWKVVTRARPVQRDFDNGDPHGKNQFLSVAATGWATAGLTRLAKIRAR